MLVIKKPVQIEAVQYTGADPDNLGPSFAETPPEWLRAALDAGTVASAGSFTQKLEIATLEGVMTCSPGDWVLRGVKGEIYPCRDDIFRATYDFPVEPRR